MDVPDVHYARAGGVAIAYQVVGDGDRDLVFAPSLSDLFTVWLNPHYFRNFLERLAAEFRLIVFNPRGTGLSDRPRTVTLEARMDDITAVMDAAGCERATLVGVSSGANACALFAATHPERCERLVMIDPAPRTARSSSYPLVPRNRSCSGTYAKPVSTGASARSSRTGHGASRRFIIVKRISSGTCGNCGSP